MLPFAFDRALFRFSLNTPALEVLFQLPPRIGMRNDGQAPLCEKSKQPYLDCLPSTYFR